MSSRIGKGPWARALGAVLVPDDSTPEAVRGEELWRQGAVEDLRIETGQITARVEGCTVTIAAPTIPGRIWDAVERYARRHSPLEQAVRGEVQSVQLEHLLAQDWEEPLIPLHDQLAAGCSCDSDRLCRHVAAVAWGVAVAIDARPGRLLAWRAARQSAASPNEERRADPSAWVGLPVPAADPAFLAQGESVLKRLGASNMNAGHASLEDVLAPAYAALVRRRVRT